MSRNQPYLHEVIHRILQDTGRPMSNEEIAAENGRRGLFRKPKDNNFPSPWQIGASALDRPKKFEIIIRLRE